MKTNPPLPSNAAVRCVCAACLAALALVAWFALVPHAQALGLSADDEHGGFTASWDDYQFVDSKTTSKSIQLRGGAFSRGKPQGYVIFRKLPGKKFKKIATVKRRAYSFNYVDRTVKAGKKYVYRFRAYRTAGGKRVYSTWSNKVEMRAVNSVGRFEVEFLTPFGSTTDTVEMKLTSKGGNGKLVLQEKGGGAGEMYYRDESTYADLEIEAISKDGATWMAPGRRAVAVKAGKTLYVRYRTADPDGEGVDPPFVFVPDPTKESWLTYEDATYAHKMAVFSVNCESESAVAYYNGEYYH